MAVLPRDPDARCPFERGQRQYILSLACSFSTMICCLAVDDSSSRFHRMILQSSDAVATTPFSSWQTPLIQSECPLMRVILSCPVPVFQILTVLSSDPDKSPPS